MSLMSLLEESRISSNLVTIEATVVTGCEHVAVNECKEKLGNSIKVVTSRGRIFFNVPTLELDSVDKLRSVDNLSIVIKHVPHLELTSKSMEEDFSILKNVIEYEDLVKAITVWSERNNFKGILFPSNEIYTLAKTSELELKTLAKAIVQSEIETSETALEEKSDQIVLDSKEERTKLNAAELIAYHELDTRQPEEKVVKYRVTCVRNGKHCFGSQDAAYHFGGRLQDMFHWVVDLNLYDMEIVLNIRNDSLYYGITLTKESKHNRNIAYFGPTTLRATICYHMLHLAQPEAGDIIIDPMCGGGSIPIEGLLAYPSSFYLCGDNHDKAVSRTEANLTNPGIDINRSHVDAFSWNVTCLPLQDSSVDIFITDLPFGKRSGSIFDNRILYKKVVVELARVVRIKTGRAVLLTTDKRSLNTALTLAAAYWRVRRKYKVNIGGLEACMYVLKRLNRVYKVPSS